MKCEFCDFNAVGEGKAIKDSTETQISIWNDNTILVRHWEDIVVTVNSEFKIAYCPFCGRNLKQTKHDCKCNGKCDK